MEVIQVMLKQKTITLTINSHGLADNLMDIGIGAILFPQPKWCHHIDTFYNVQNLIEFLFGQFLALFWVDLLYVLG